MWIIILFIALKCKDDKKKIFTMENDLVSSMLNSYEYHPFGDTLNPANDETARIGFIGQERDIEPRHSSGSPLRSDMVYFNIGARYYDPDLGRFLSVDPLLMFNIIIQVNLIFYNFHKFSYISLKIMLRGKNEKQSKYYNRKR